MKGEKCPRHNDTEQRDPNLDPPWGETTLGEHVVYEEVEKNHNTSLKRGSEGRRGGRWSSDKWGERAGIEKERE